MKFVRACAAAVAVLCLVGATPGTSAQCEAPKPLPVTTTPLAAGSTYYSDGEPPERFRAMPKGFIKVRFGRAAIDEMCGVPPCNMRFLGCVRGDVMVLPDPSDPDFARVTRHELGHWNGWPATHGA